LFLQAWIDGANEPIVTMPQRIGGVPQSKDEWVHMRRTVRVEGPVKVSVDLFAALRAQLCVT